MPALAKRIGCPPNALAKILHEDRRAAVSPETQLMAPASVLEITGRT